MPDNNNGRKHLPPVAWLLGRQLIASLKWILLYTAFGSKLDARDWMDAKVYPSDNQAEADNKWKAMRLAREAKSDAAADSQSGTDYWAGKEFWFDYLSDTGDGTKATYSIAYLCLSNLWMQDRFEKGPPEEGRDSVKLEQFKDANHPEPLPRGEFLLVGGDTSYHLSDYATLHLRFQTPFNWAYQDLARDLKNQGTQIDNAATSSKAANRRPLFGIPGNHDYYDMLDGFRRQFRTPVLTRPESKDYPAGDLTGPQLMIDGFRREQDTSYLALQLPFGWMLWGLDTEVGKIDERQRDFFQSTNGGEKPEKLIVATSAPTTVFGKRADRDDEKCSKAFYQLKLARPFIQASEKEAGEPDLTPNEIRLDIAGDVHQYARYWGPAKKDNQSRGVATAAAPSASNYASVVSGLGGAFHHPSTTYVDEIREQALYPTEEVSRATVAKEIFNPIKVFRGGGVGVIGAAIALILTFAAIANDSSRPAIHNFAPFVWLNLTQPERYRSTVVVSAEPEKEQKPQPSARPTPAGSGDAATNVQPTKITPARGWRWLGVPEWTPAVKDTTGPDGQPCSDNKQIYLWGGCSVEWPIDYLLGMVMLVLTLGVIIATFILTELEYKKIDTQQDVKAGAREPDTPEDVPSKKNTEKAANKVLRILVPTLILNVLLIIGGVFSIIPYRAFITPFGNSLWVFLTLIWAVSSVIFSVRYSDWLFVQASKTTVTWTDWLITWALAVATIASLAVGLWLFGKNNLPAYLAADIVFVTVLLASFFGLIYVAASTGGQHQRLPGKVAMGFLGVWHWLVQLGVALLLLKKGTWLTLLLAIPIFFLFMMVGRWFLTKNFKWRLVVAWLAYGVVMFALPPLVYKWMAGWSDQYAAMRSAFFWPHVFGPESTFASYEWWGNFGEFWQLVTLLLACALGLIFSCIWVGWYFAVCLRFNGHNNETGGAARIEKYKQFIRIRLRRDDLTGYVIAINEPLTDGSKLDVKLVDVFQLTRQPQPGGLAKPVQ